MAVPLRSDTTTQGRRMAGARSLWRTNGMTEEMIGRPVIAIVNSFTQFVPGHVHLHEIGQRLKRIIGLIEDGDTIHIDIPKRTINADVSDDELDRRRKREEARGKDAFTPPPRPRRITAALKAYGLLASSADKGATRVLPD